MTNTASRIISDETLSRIIQIESAGNPNAKAPTSSAAGLGQFILATWRATIAKHRSDLAGKPGLDSMRFGADTAKLQVEMLARFTEDNAKALGPGYSDGDLYLAHFAGVGTARKVLRTAPDTPCSVAFSAAAINANKSILAGKTCGEVRAWADRKMAAAGGRNWVAKWYGGAPALKANPAIVGGGVGGAAVVVGGGAAAASGASWMVVAAWIVGIVAAIIIAGLLGYRAIKGRWIWQKPPAEPLPVVAPALPAKKPAKRKPAVKRKKAA